ncbi:MAG: toxin-antitoxin system protein [Candidatus Omnitrophota bacterium]|jgi:hypothetical protein|nr:MAG: toxin-antitoxin system protein [Candidatus Omnitrophota bacterium]
MATLTVRIEETTHKTLRELSEKSGESMQFLLSKTIEEYRRTAFLESANQAYARLHKYPQKWKEEQQERTEWDITLNHDLDNK